MIYAEAAYAGPDYLGRTFKAEPCHHCAAWTEHQRLERIRKTTQRAMARKPRREVTAFQLKGWLV